MRLDEAIDGAAELVAGATEQAMRLLKTGGVVFGGP